MAIYYHYAALFCENVFIGVDCAQQASSTAARSRLGIYNDGLKTGLFCFNTTNCLPYALDIDSSSCDGDPSTKIIGTTDIDRTETDIYRTETEAVINGRTTEVIVYDNQDFAEITDVDKKPIDAECSENCSILCFLYC